MAGVGIVFGFLAGVVADSQALAALVAAITFLVTVATFVLPGRPHRRPTIGFNPLTRSERL